MRTIKFRAWDFQENKMISWDELTSGKHPYNHLTMLRSGLGLVHFQQYTGLKDKNGKEIYEGDILDDGFDNALPLSMGWYEFLDGARVNCWILQYLDEHLVLTDKLLKDCEVIGNIYENPELLK